MIEFAATRVSLTRIFEVLAFAPSHSLLYFPALSQSRLLVPTSSKNILYDFAKMGSQHPHHGHGGMRKATSFRACLLASRQCVLFPVWLDNPLLEVCSAWNGFPNFSASIHFPLPLTNQNFWRLGRHAGFMITPDTYCHCGKWALEITSHWSNEYSILGLLHRNWSGRTCRVAICEF